MNIQTMLTALSEKGLTDEKIAAEIGATQPTVTRLRNGVHKKTDYERYNQVLAIYQREFPAGSEGEVAKAAA
jgi:DNA-binding CsgD family transcriptional regulator